MVKVIYRMLNKINGKSYIGQTNNFKQRMRGHKSDAFCKTSYSYETPLSYAIRKYGWENFENYILESIIVEDYNYIDERERFYIKYFNSLSKNNGYNITTGGQNQNKKPKLTYEEKLQKSKLFTPEEIKDIQKMLIENCQGHEIREKYPQLTTSFLGNINLGLNFKNENFDYPLSKKQTFSICFTKKEIEEIKNDIKNGMIYIDIAKKWNITIGFISAINNGKTWFDKKEKYPLCIKGCSKIHNLIWVIPVQQDLIENKLTMTEIAKKYNKAYSTIKKINSGASHKNPEYIYPLRKGQKRNK